MSTSTKPPGRIDALAAAVATGDLAAPSENRQLTVMFADLVGSTSLLEEHGPEAFSDLLRIYHNLCTEATRNQDGTVANYLGDGVISYFGYPRATEDDPLRALQAAWTILQNLRQDSGRSVGLALAARIGVATGRVIIHQKPGDHYGENVVGACLNKAARLQALAPENTAIVCGVTRRLVGRAFEFEDLGPRSLKGFERPEKVYSLKPRRRKGLSRFEALRGERRTPFVGRDQELAALRAMVARAADGAGGAAVLVGEPGIGKSRLVEALRQSDAHELRYLSMQCSPMHQFSSLQPVKDYLDWVSGVNADDAPEIRRDKLRRLFHSAWQTNEDDTAVLMDVVASSGPEQEANADIGLLLKRRMAFQILSHKVFSTAAPGRPLLLVFEDVHWIDPTSAEFLENLVRNAPKHACVVLATSRREGPLADRLYALGDVIQLERLSDAQSTELAKAAGGSNDLDLRTLQTIVEKSDGIPLFVEEYAATLIHGGGSGQGPAGPADRKGIPLTLGGLVQNKFDRLNPHAQNMARIGATIGRVFDLQLVRTLSGLGQAAFDRALDAIEAADVAYRDAGTGGRPTASFKHALVRDAIYASFSSAERRRLHGIVADLMLELEDDGRRIAAEVLAEHLLLSGRHAESAEWRLAAAMAAAGEGSAAEALAHITRGLAAIELLPEGQLRDRLELQLRAIEGPTLMVTRGPGNPAFGAAQARALTLLRAQDNRDSLVPVIYNTALHAWACGRLARADDVTDEIFQILEAEPSDGAFLAAHTMRGLVAWHRGDNQMALAQLSATVDRYDPTLHREFYTRFLKEFGVFGRFYLGLTRTVMGDAGEGARQAEAALELARHVRRPHAYGFALLANFVTAMMGGDVASAASFSEESLEFAGRQGFPEFAAMSLVCQGWVKARRGEIDAGIRQMEEGAGLWAMTGFENWQAYFATLLSDAYVAAGRLEEATLLLDRHDERVARFGEAQFEPPLARSRALLLAAQGDPDGAALELSKAQRLAARNLAALWQTA